MAESSLTPEQRVVVHRIRALMAFWQITPEELAEADIGPAPVPPPPLPSAPKYRHPRSGETWDGQGSQPDWLRQALLREGFLVEELRIEAGESLGDAPTLPEAGTVPADLAAPRETSAR